MSLKLKVIRPDKNFVVRNNHLVLNPVNLGSNKIFQDVKTGHIFAAIGSDTIPVKAIALAGHVRTWLEYPYDDKIRITPYTKPVDELVSISIRFTPKSPKQPFGLDTSQLEQCIISRVNGSTINLGQEFDLRFESRLFAIRVLDLESVNGSVPFGMINKFMRVNVKETNNLIHVLGSKTKLNLDFDFDSIGVGGLDREFTTLFRRAFVTRIFPPEFIEKIGLDYVRGIILHGPPGTGKTLVARQIGKLLGCVEPKIVNGPEILNRYVGQSEENLRNLFSDAESDPNPTNLHLIIFDEIDALCKSRGSTSTAVNDSIVNQLLTKMDGINVSRNILVIGMTNRIDLLDRALLRPGRFELQLEFKLPDESGRKQILDIHTRRMGSILNSEIDFDLIAKRTRNFTGAEIAGLVKSAASYAFQSAVDVTDLSNTDPDRVHIKQEHFDLALQNDAKASVAEEVTEPEFYFYSSELRSKVGLCLEISERLVRSDRYKSDIILIRAPRFCGSTSFAKYIAVNSEFNSCIRIISPDKLIGLSEQAKCHRIIEIFREAEITPRSVVIIDSLDRLIEFNHLGPRLSNTVYQTIRNLCDKQRENRMFILITIDTQVDGALNFYQEVPYAVDLRQLVPNEIQFVLTQMNSQLVITNPVGIKQLIKVAE